MNPLVSNFYNSYLGAFPEEILEPILLNIGRVGTLSRCRQVCKGLALFMHEKNLFQRYIDTCIPETEMLDYWRTLLQNESYDYININVFGKHIVHAESTCDSILDKQFPYHDLLMLLLETNPNTPIFKLARHIEHLLLNHGNANAKNAAFDCIFYNFYECKFHTNQSDNLVYVISLLKSIAKLSIQKKPYIYELLAEIPEKELTQAKKQFINDLDKLIRSDLFQQLDRLTKLALLANDTNLEVSTDARRHLRALINDKVYHNRDTFIEGVLESNSIIGYSIKAMALHTIVYCFALLIFFMRGGINLFSTGSNKNLLKFVEYTAAFILNVVATSLIFAPIERTLRYEIRLDHCFYQWLSVLLVTNLILLATLLI